MLRLNFPSLDASRSSFWRDINNVRLIVRGSPSWSFVSVLDCSYSSPFGISTCVVYFRPLLFSQHRTPFSRRILVHRAVVCAFLAVTMHLYPRAASKFCMTHIPREKIASLMFGHVCRNGQARSRSINYFHAYRMQIVQSDFIYRCRARLMDFYHLYAPRLSMCSNNPKFLLEI